MKYSWIIGIIFLSLLTGAVYMYTDTQIQTTQTNTDLAGEADAGTIEQGDTDTEEPVQTNATLTEDEIEMILFMKEEEKLARDVYLTLYDMWGLQIFQNIARSEQNHMDAVTTLIEKYGLEDPAVDEIGVFTNQELQELYDQLIERASQSELDALLVGALIEEKDIVDINNLLSMTNNTDIISVFENLKGGSINHLKAFSSTYENMSGEPYTPQLISPDLYQELLQTPGSGNATAWS